MARATYVSTNEKFAKESKLFNIACEIAGVSSTRRQASKFRMKKGQAYKWASVAKIELAKDARADAIRKI